MECGPWWPLDSGRSLQAHSLNKSSSAGTGLAGTLAACCTLTMQHYSNIGMVPCVGPDQLQGHLHWQRPHQGHQRWPAKGARCRHCNLTLPLLTARSTPDYCMQRTNIGIALIADPRVLMLDEPTSGLDSFSANEVCLFPSASAWCMPHFCLLHIAPLIPPTHSHSLLTPHAFQVMTLVKSLAQDGRTVVATIHSPTAYAFDLFDTVLMLVRGRTVYFGPRGTGRDRRGCGAGGVRRKGREGGERSRQDLLDGQAVAPVRHHLATWCSCAGCAVRCR